MPEFEAVRADEIGQLVLLAMGERFDGGLGQYLPVDHGAGPCVGIVRPELKIALDVVGRDGPQRGDVVRLDADAFSEVPAGGFARGSCFRMAVLQPRRSFAPAAGLDDCLGEESRGGRRDHEIIDR